jgi:hypothetical protein
MSTVSMPARPSIAAAVEPARPPPMIATSTCRMRVSFNQSGKRREAAAASPGRRHLGPLKCQGKQATAFNLKASNSAQTRGPWDVILNAWHLPASVYDTGQLAL